MLTVTLQEAKAKLHKLVAAARAGQDVVLMCGSQVAVRLQPLSSEDLELASSLTDTQAEHFWRDVDKDLSKKPTKVFRSPKNAVQFLKKKTPQ